MEKNKIRLLRNLGSMGAQLHAEGGLPHGPFTRRRHQDSGGAPSCFYPWISSPSPHALWGRWGLRSTYFTGEKTEDREASKCLGRHGSHGGPELLGPGRPNSGPSTSPPPAEQRTPSDAHTKESALQVQPASGPARVVPGW